jgi:hypothetical protein
MQEKNRSFSNSHWEQGRRTPEVVEFTQIADLFARDKSVISRHLRGVQSGCHHLRRLPGQSLSPSINEFGDLIAKAREKANKLELNNRI